MVTNVGTQDSFAAAVKELLELDYDAIEAYEAAIARLSNAEYKSKLQEFCEDHKRHVRELQYLLFDRGVEAPTGPSNKSLLTKGKVVLANLLGDDAVLAAMLTNEQDTNTAYERMNQRNDKWEEAASVLEDGLRDERKHKSWLEHVTKPEKVV